MFSIAVALVGSFSISGVSAKLNNTGGVRPDGADPVLDCALRQLSLEFGTRLFPDDPSIQLDLFDGLELGVLCNRTRPMKRAPKRHVRDGVALNSNTPANAVPHAGGVTPEPDHSFFVDALVGDDVAGDGSLHTPFATVHRAVDESRRTPAHATVVLRAGTHFLSTPLTLGPADSGLTLTSVAGEEAVISGGTQISGLKWSRAGPPLPANVFVADLPRTPNTSSFDALFVDGRLEIRARWPNGDPETTGLHTSPTGWQTGGSWASVAPKPTTKPSTVTIPQISRPGPDFNVFTMEFGGLTERYTPAMSKWGGTPRPTALTANTANKTFGPYRNVSSGVLHAFHGSHWGGWQFRITGMTQGNGSVTFALDPWGGQQEARGKTSGAEWRLDNLLEELDVQREWFHDEAASKLYYFPANETAPPDSVVVASLKRLVHVNGTIEAPVRNVSFRAVKFTASAPTFLDAYEVPSGGDWSIHRGGALFASGVVDMVVESCFFERLGGNALFLSNFARNTLISNNEFAWLGDSAVAAVGSTRYAQSNNVHGTDLMDGTDGNQPRGTVFRSNVVREIGIYGKQTSAFIQSLACNTTIESSLLFNGPRAGINFNDGFGGGNTITDCLTFNWVRETSDHGQFNSWDRLPYLTDTTGKKSTAIAENRIFKNLMWNNFHSTWPIDHDDGSCFYTDTDNYLIYGGAKNYLGHSKVNLRNFYINADLGASPVCMVDDSPNAQDTFANCTCTHSTGGIYEWQHYSGCGKGVDLNKTAERCYNNKFFTSDGDIHLQCADGVHNFSWWQAEGYDKGSTVANLPLASTVEGWARSLFDLPTPSTGVQKTTLLSAARATEFAIGVASDEHEGYSKATLSELHTSAFAEFYNYHCTDKYCGGLAVAGNKSFRGCCVLEISDGYVELEGTLLSTFTPSGEHVCDSTLTPPLFLGGATQPGTTWSGKFLGRHIETSMTSKFTATPSYSHVPGCADARDSLVLLSSRPPSPPPPPPPPPPKKGCTKVDPGERIDCGFHLTEEECLEKECCWDESNPHTFRCFFPDVCSEVDPAERKDCGLNLNEEECLAKGCCYDDTVPFTYYCFEKPRPPRTFV